MKKWCKRLSFYYFPAFMICAYLGIAWLGSKITLSPKRKTLESFQKQILEKPVEYGLAVENATSPSRVPYLICEPALGGEAKKSHILRDHMAQSSVDLPPWGQIRGTIIALHAHKGRKEDLLPVTERFCAAGFRCICPDLPGHGENPSANATFGVKELPLLRELWRNHITKYPDHQSPLFFFGYSQGGVISLKCAADHSNWNVRAVASVNAFATLDQPIRASVDHLPPMLRNFPGFITNASAVGIWCREGVWPSDIGPIHHAPSITCPALIIHAANDTFVPPAQGDAIYQAIPHQQKKRVTVANAGHHNALSTGSTPLYAEICEWFLQALPES